MAYPMDNSAHGISAVLLPRDDLESAVLDLAAVLEGLVADRFEILLITPEPPFASNLQARAPGLPLRYALAVSPPAAVPASLNGFALWNSLLLVYMVVAYGYPIGQFFYMKSHSAPVYDVTHRAPSQWRVNGTVSTCQFLAADRLGLVGGGRRHFCCSGLCRAKPVSTKWPDARHLGRDLPQPRDHCRYGSGK